MENEHGESYDQIKLICFEDVLKKLEHIQEINKDTFLNLNAKKTGDLDEHWNKSKRTEVSFR